MQIVGVADGWDDVGAGVFVGANVGAVVGSGGKVGSPPGGVVGPCGSFVGPGLMPPGGPSVGISPKGASPSPMTAA